MPPRHPLPRLWLMTDERMGEGLWDALARLPRGSGVIFRHYATSPADRRRLFDRVRRVARARRLVLVLAGSSAQAIAWHADGVHGRSGQRLAPRGLIRTAPVHSRMELIAARRSGADLALLSPVFPTRSHPHARTLGPVGFARLAATAGLPIIALGGMDARRFRALRELGAYGWAGIDALGPGAVGVRT